jgi:hypothetical protein
MNSDEVTQTILLIDAAYGPKMKAADRDMDLVIEVWTIALSDIPWKPHGENALSWWLKNEPWPPSPADLRERAKATMRAERGAHESAELLRRYAPLPARKMAPIAIRREAVRRLTAGEISGADLEREIERLVAESTGSHA